MADIIRDFVNYMDGVPYSEWYVGITANPRKRLFNDHNVSEHSGVYICKDAGSESAAREIEGYFLNLGTDGGGGGGDGSSRYVYAYRKTPTTNEDN